MAKEVISLISLRMNYSGYMENIGYRIIEGDCIVEMAKMLQDGVKVDLTVTSPPYDNLRSYEGTLLWDFDKFKEVARLLYDITNDGGVVVWVVSDQTVKGNKSLTSFRQALYFQEIGFNFYDNIIYEKNSSSFPQSKKSKRYSDVYEYCFVLTKGKIRLLRKCPRNWLLTMSCHGVLKVMLFSIRLWAAVQPEKPQCPMDVILSESR